VTARVEIFSAKIRGTPAARSESVWVSGDCRTVEARAYPIRTCRAVAAAAAGRDSSAHFVILPDCRTIWQSCARQARLQGRETGWSGSLTAMTSGAWWPPPRRQASCTTRLEAGLPEVGSAYGELTAVASGRLADRTAGDELTVADLTGPRIQDAAVAAFAARLAGEHGVGRDVPPGDW
jgi:hypothetical protein